MTAKPETVTRLIREVRTCFNQLRSLAENLNADLDVNPSMRAVMESLARDAHRTVPDLAKERGTSRQHVQKVINGLLDQELVKASENPEHKRSVLYLLTSKGDQVFAEIRRREAAPMRALSEALSQADIEQTSDVLSRMNQTLDHLINQGEST
ncbi:MarR family winged helix-turn-helix transcriptional regulator [Ruegeria profundi]|uniref:HTH marR-type domain-containing protein n=1 Tax=Ruegeria profundi TaxID=1685378 RepID=A0A0X3TQ19_9RHOB|nr:MarR family winged helix-turn-helix transcriptional regulator [Ruegeria profundi]KUJ77779.1 hypothetical protein AVO44_15745 [Ruegeria profundi]